MSSASTKIARQISKRTLIWAMIAVGCSRQSGAQLSYANVDSAVWRTLTAEIVQLGEELFFDRRLSLDQTRSCATCHNPELEFTDGLTVSTPTRPIARNAQTLINKIFSRHQTFDGAAASLEAQVLRPMVDPFEMGMTENLIFNRLAGDIRYGELFAQAFGVAPNVEDMQSAIAAFQRTIVSVDSSYDRFMAGDTSALNQLQRKGMELFFGEAGCATCHSGQTFTDEQFRLSDVAKTKSASRDLGRYLVTRTDSDRYRFKTPTLRQITKTAPYFHDGSAVTLDDVMTVHAPVANSADKAAILAFLRAISDGRTVFGGEGLAILSPHLIGEPFSASLSRLWSARH